MKFGVASFFGDKTLPNFQADAESRQKQLYQYIAHVIKVRSGCEEKSHRTPSPFWFFKELLVRLELPWNSSTWADESTNAVIRYTVHCIDIFQIQLATGLEYVGNKPCGSKTV